MKYLYFLIILVCFSKMSAFAQTTIARGFVLDENTKTPIPYVNISILKSQIGTSSHENGSYILEIAQEDLGKNIKLTSLGYKDSIVSVSRFLKHKTIFLNPLVEQLNEVVITKKFEEKFLIVNPISKKNLCGGYGSNAMHPWIIALFYPYKDEYESTDYLNSVKIHFGNFKNKKAKFRLRLFSMGKNGFPDKDLLTENLIVETKKKQKIAEVDLSQFNLIFPSEGFFVAFEWLYIPFNEYQVTFVFGKDDLKGKHKEKRIRHSPIISATCQEIGKSKLVAYISGKWKDNSKINNFSGDKWIPAFSLTLSN